MSKPINITSTVDNETIVENLIFDWLSNETNITEPGNNHERNFARQYPLGNKRTDFTTIYRDEKGPVCIIIECKNKSKDHSLGEEQVKGYMETVKNSNDKLNIIGVTASLTPKKTLKLTAFWQIGNDVKEIKAKADIKYLVSQTRKDEEGISKKRAKIASWRETLGKELAQLHNYVRNYCKAPANEKVNLINGVFIALRSSDFRKNLNKYQDVAYSRNIYNSIISVMLAESHDTAQIQYIKDSFAFLNIETHPTNDNEAVPAELLNDVHITGSISFNKFICNYISNKFIIYYTSNICRRLFEFRIFF